MSNKRLAWFAWAAALTCSLAGCTMDIADSEDLEESSDALTVGNRPWDDQAEVEWSNWVAKIGAARASGACTSVNSCMNNSSINNLRSASDPALSIPADCADLPMVMRAYFAVKTNRPFQYVSSVTAADGGDVRYGKGITPNGFRSVRSYSSLQKLLTAIGNNVHSGHYRMAGGVEGSDTYPVDVTAKTIRPGTVFYDPNGHVLLVYKVESNGLVRLMDGHPDQSLTYGILSEKHAVGGASQGGGFRNFRPYSYAGGNFVRATNASLTNAKYGLNASAQYGRGREYYNWVRTRLSGGAPIQPENEFKELTSQLCVDLKDRAIAVASAAHIADTGPGRVPANIYGASGEWEEFSTPSRDARFKASFRGIHRFITSTKELVDARSNKIAWTKTSAELMASYKRIWSSTAASCTVAYKRGNGVSKTLSLSDIETRLFDLSFDPYHCIELRWGAHSGTEYTSCKSRNSQTHSQRYADERRQRNAIDREYGQPTPFTWGPSTPEDVNVTKLLGRLTTP